MKIRNATTDDADGILKIYNHYIENTEITFELTPLSVEDMTIRVSDISALYPYIVCEEDGDIIGYAYLSKWKSREAYSHSLETTFYVHPGSIGRGIGRLMMKYIIDAARTMDVHALIGVIAIPNDASERLHESFGFKKVAHFPEVGHKFDKWIDISCWQLIL